MSLVQQLFPFSAIYYVSACGVDLHRLLCGWLGISLLLLAISLLLMPGGDEWVADLVYRWQGKQWAYQDAWWLENILHRGGRWISQCAGGIVFLALLVACCNTRWRRWRKPLLYLLLAVGFSTGLVSVLKHLTHMDCPWDLYRYGGTRPFIGLFELRPASSGRAACFPSGHASAGYAWIALYFFALVLRPGVRHYALGLALTAGIVFGFAQQLRGAHFLSHDLVTLAVSWAVAAVLFVLMFRREMQA